MLIRLFSKLIKLRQAGLAPIECRMLASNLVPLKKMLQVNFFHQNSIKIFKWKPKTIHCKRPKNYLPLLNYSTSVADSLDLSLSNPQLGHYLQKLKTKYSDLQNYSPRDAGRLQPIMELLHQAESADQDVKELQELVSNSAENCELAQLAAEDLPGACSAAQHYAQQLLLTLVRNNTSQPTAGRDVIMELSAGVGGQEAMLFCQELWLMYQQCAAERGWRFQEVECSESELGGLRLGHAVVSSPGHEDVYSLLRHEVGTHRVQRAPKTEKSGRLHTSTAVVVVMLQPNELDVKILPKDLKIETMKSSGPGGQSVNTTDSAVRVTHIPTGTVVESQRERAQHLNKAFALARLRAILFQREQDKEAQSTASQRKLQVGTRGRSEKIRTYNFAQDRVTDHRIGVTIHNVNGVLSGGDVLTQLLDRLQQYALLEDIRVLLQSDP